MSLVSSFSVFLGTIREITVSRNKEKAFIGFILEDLRLPIEYMNTTYIYIICKIVNVDLLMAWIFPLLPDGADHWPRIRAWGVQFHQIFSLIEYFRRYEYHTSFDEVTSLRLTLIENVKVIFYLSFVFNLNHHTDILPGCRQNLDDYEPRHEVKGDYLWN